jgi:outer membrane lipoprotein SlyB
MRRISLWSPAILLLAALLLTACASSLSGSAYSRSQARTAQEVQLGTVEHVRVVLIEGTKSGVGVLAGGAAGSIVGREAGSSPVGRALGGIAGGVLGGVAGAAAEEAVTRQQGYEITVKLDSGRLIAVTQAADEEFKVGERVRVIYGGRGGTRVTH